MPFDTIIGHERPKRFLQAALRSQRLAHALLFHGAEQIGKLLTARVLAQAVNCEASLTPDPPDACGVCRSCHQIETGDGDRDVPFDADAAMQQVVDEIGQRPLGTK